MFRAYQVVAKADGAPYIDISPFIDSVEWDIYQISVQTGQQNDACTCEIHHNMYFLCGTNQGFKDSAVGPPDAIVQAKDNLRIVWANVNPGDICIAAVWYNENPAGTTVSLAH